MKHASGIVAVVAFLTTLWAGPAAAFFHPVGPASPAIVDYNAPLSDPGADPAAAAAPSSELEIRLGRAWSPISSAYESELLRPVERRIISPEIDIDLPLLDRGRAIQVSGPLGCAEAEPQVHFRVTVTQRSSGALGEGRWSGACSLTTRSWKTRVQAHGVTRFESGPAQACALGVAYHRGRRVDAWQWCRDVQLRGQ